MPSRPGVAYADVVRALVARRPRTKTARAGTPSSRPARAFTATHGPTRREALAAWRAHRGRGVVVLPTGAGKSHVALLAIDDKRRSTLVVAPTLDLVRQWYDLSRRRSACPSASSAAASTTCSRSP